MNWVGATGFNLYWAPNYSYNATAVRSGFAINKEIAEDHYFYNPDDTENPRTNLTAKYPRFTTSWDNNLQASTRFLFKGDYLKLKNLTVGYTIPKFITNKFTIQSFRVYFSGENLLTITDFPGQDPELGAYPTYTSVRNLAFGVNITF
jgi:hypothetical protein